MESGGTRGGVYSPPMSALWDELEFPGPVLLANQDNDPVIQERTTTLKEGDVPTLAQQHAFEKSARRDSVRDPRRGISACPSPSRDTFYKLLGPSSSHCISC